MIICKRCQQDISQKARSPYEVNIPQDVVFKSRIAKFGRNRRIIEIPKKQRDFLEDDLDYIIIIKSLEA